MGGILFSHLLLRTTDLFLAGFFTLVRSKPGDESTEEGSHQEGSARVNALEDVHLQNGGHDDEDRVDLEERAAHG